MAMTHGTNEDRLLVKNGKLQADTKFTVDLRPLVLQTTEMPDVQVQVLVEADGGTPTWRDYIMAGAPVVIGADSTYIFFVKGLYRLDPNATYPADAMVRVYDDYAPDQKNMVFVAPPLAKASPSMDPGVEAGNPTGLYDDATGMPVFSVIDDAGAIIELYYHHPTTGAKTVTTTGFSAAPPQTNTVPEEMYDTLPTGVIERITKHTTYTDGVPTAISYTEIDTAAAYVPAGTVAAKPQKIQMTGAAASLDINVTGAAGTGLGLTGTANSKGQMFPQNVLIHVHVDSADNASGIAYSTDGTAPSEAHEFERSEGQPIVLDTWEEATNFLAVPLDRNGDLAPAEAIQITIEPNNIGEDKDDV